MKFINDMKKGDKVTYIPTGEWGIIKDFTAGPGMGLYVVFNCGEDWENYKDYTAALCQEKHIKLGWVNDNQDA